MDSQVTLVFHNGVCTNFPRRTNPLGLTATHVRQMWEIIRDKLYLTDYNAGTVMVEIRQSPDGEDVLDLSVYRLPPDTDGDGRY